MRGLTVVFDLDGTLVDTAPDLVAATNHALTELALSPIDVPALRAFIGHGARCMIIEALRLHGRELPEAEVDELLSRFLNYYEANIANQSRPFEGAVETLGELKAAGAKLAVCTNKREGLSRQLLKELAMHECFDAIAGRDTFAVCKPHPDHLLGTVRLAGGDPSQAIMIGDTAVDVGTAAAAGVPAVAVTFGYSDRPAEQLGAEISINHFRELSAAITRICQPGASKNPR